MSWNVSIVLSFEEMRTLMHLGMIESRKTTFGLKLQYYWMGGT